MGINLLDLISDAMAVPELVDSGPAALPGIVIVNDDISTRANLMIKVDEAVHRRFVEVAIGSQQRQLSHGCSGQSVPKPAFEELHLSIEQAESCEIVLHVLEGGAKVVPIAEIGGPL